MLVYTTYSIPFYLLSDVRKFQTCMFKLIFLRMTDIISAFLLMVNLIASAVAWCIIFLPME